MERFSDHNDLATALAEIRPAPRDAFANELDKRVAASFQRPTRLAGFPLAGFVAWVRRLPPKRLLFAGGASALTAIVVATVLVAGGGPGTSGSPPANGLLSQFTPLKSGDSPGSGASPRGAAPESSVLGRGGHAATVHPSESASGGEYSASNGSFKAGRLANPSPHRDVERAAEISLLADPSDVSEDSNKIFAAVHDANGIVLHSTTGSGKGAGARFELLIPNARLGDALAAFSSIDEVRSRHEATDDITRPTVSTEEKLQEVQARVDSLLAQLADAELESEREVIAAELHAERGHATRLRDQLARLHQRTTYSRVLVRIRAAPPPNRAARGESARRSTTPVASSGSRRGSPWSASP